MPLRVESYCRGLGAPLCQAFRREVRECPLTLLPSYFVSGIVDGEPLGTAGPLV